MLRTGLCDLLGIDVPIVLAPFGPWDEVRLAAEVCNAGPATGTVVTFRTSGGPVTHRVIGAVPDGLETQGDANQAPDPWTIPQRNVVGEVVGGVPFVGCVLVFFQQPSGVPSLVLLALSVMFAWSLFFPAGPEGTPERRRRRRRPRPLSAEQPHTAAHPDGRVPGSVSRMVVMALPVGSPRTGRGSSS